MPNIRKAQIAGSFYPGDEDELKSNLEKMLAQHKNLAIKNIYGIVAPHAGYMYSGKIAAKVYKQIANQDYKNIIVISPSHYDYFEGCSVYAGNYETPLGLIQANNSFIDALCESDIISISNLGHQKEHALEIQLPFLQLIAPDFNLIPIVMGTQNFKTAEKLAKAIFSVLGNTQHSTQKTLIVSSSDLSHFYDIKQANILDAVIVNDIEAFDINRLNEDILEKKTHACGFGTILAGMMTCQLLGATKSNVLDYGTSADVNKDFSKVVGYLSAVFYKN